MNWKSAVFDGSTPIAEVISEFDRSPYGVALIVDDKEKLEGIVTDGDIRKALLKEVDTGLPVSEIMNRNPIVAYADQSETEITCFMRKKTIHYLPVVDRSGVLKGIRSLDDLSRIKTFDNPVILMAGGYGERLMPLTKDCPKPLLKIGEKPLLEMIIESFIDQGFNNFYISVYYKADMIRKHFGDGAKWGVSINYLLEKKKLGTAGSLGLLPTSNARPMIVMNGDLLTKVDFIEMLEYHERKSASMTIGSVTHDVHVPYGTLEIEEENILKSINEKPSLSFPINAGIYVLDQKCMRFINKGARMDMNDLITNLLGIKERVFVFPIKDYWMDIGSVKDFNSACRHFSDLN
ncbi:MAG: nucleotidyltransferase family protein [Syntrophales bacterium]|nr:nucleotidyltransferase family protein [Syntrophales bacterium]